MVVIPGPNVHGEMHLVRDDVPRVGIVLDLPDRGDHVALHPIRQRVHRQDHLRGRAQGVMPSLHGGRAHLVRLALQVHVVPVQAEDALGSADGLALPLQHGALLDVVFDSTHAWAISCAGTVPL